jgi:hypothetical protein
MCAAGACAALPHRRPPRGAAHGPDERRALRLDATDDGDIHAIGSSSERPPGLRKRRPCAGRVHREVHDVRQPREATTAPVTGEDARGSQPSTSGGGTGWWNAL